ncbi:MAG: hypothetical protein IPJ90_03525 [Anaerolineaceae bacterium]|nr:hypothetical protein [Anaerolineaceae bacterium]
MMEEGLYGDISEPQSRTLRQILHSSEQLTELVNSLIDQAQLESGTLALRVDPFSPQLLAQEVEFSLGVMAAAKGLAFTLHIAPGLPDVVVGIRPG